MNLKKAKIGDEIVVVREGLTSGPYKTGDVFEVVNVVKRRSSPMNVFLNPSLRYGITIKRKDISDDVCYTIAFENSYETFALVKKPKNAVSRPTIRQSDVSGALLVNSAIKEIENLMERWHLGRDNDNETLHGINDVLVKIGLLGWFNKQ